MTALCADYAWSHPKPSDIRHAGFVGVMRYFSHDPSKNLTLDEVKALHAVGLWVGVVWETTASRAEEGRRAGIDDRKAAESMARALRWMPPRVPIFYAVDEDTEPAKVVEYFRGIVSGNTRVAGAYGGIRVIQGLKLPYKWQTQAWSQNAVSPEACLYQRVRPTVRIPNAVGSYDENVVLKAFPVWAPLRMVTAPKVPAPKPPVQSTPHPDNPDHDLVVAMEKWKAAKGLTG